MCVIPEVLEYLQDKQLGNTVKLQTHFRRGYKETLANFDSAMTAEKTTDASRGRGTTFKHSKRLVHEAESPPCIIHSLRRMCSCCDALRVP